MITIISISVYIGFDVNQQDENGERYPAAHSDRSENTLTPDPELLSCKSGRSGRSSKSDRSGISNAERSILDNIADIAGAFSLNYIYSFVNSVNEPSI